MLAATINSGFLRAQSMLYNYSEDGCAFLDIECADGSLFRFSLEGINTSIKLDSLEPNVAALIRDYSIGRVTLAHVREAFGLAAPKTELDVFAEAASKKLAFLVDELTNRPDDPGFSDDDDLINSDEPEFSEEDSDESVYLTLPSTVSETTILRLLEEIRSSPSTAGKQITINISKEGHEPRYFNTAGSNLSTE